ncbi:MAG: hypothetical protein J07HX64_01040 [halophilic archaeon J07HX64]|nr:MAG: hypothetical protein J07HX64_01040 [halophilic archaeon J07HX64]
MYQHPDKYLSQSLPLSANVHAVQSLSAVVHGERARWCGHCRQSAHDDVVTVDGEHTTTRSGTEQRPR